jgi:hypothetical protein
MPGAGTVVYLELAPQAADLWKPMKTIWQEWMVEHYSVSFTISAVVEAATQSGVQVACASLVVEQTEKNPTGNVPTTFLEVQQMPGSTTRWASTGTPPPRYTFKAGRDVTWNTTSVDIVDNNKRVYVFIATLPQDGRDSAIVIDGQARLRTHFRGIHAIDRIAGPLPTKVEPGVSPTNEDDDTVVVAPSAQARSGSVAAPKPGSSFPQRSR